MVKVLLNGSKGRMGQAIQAIAASEEIEIVTAADLGDDISAGLEACEVVVDFSFHAATLPLAELAAEAGKPLVIGTTGHTASEKEAIAALSGRVPMVWAGNFSVGVNLLFYLVGKAAHILGRDYHPELIEMHHRHKVDAPSGTAEHLLSILREARNLTTDQTKHGRSGMTGERPDDEIGMHALRGGDVVGDHTVMFAGPGERIELTHRASDRRIFAQGALRAAHWVLGKPPGLYRVEDVLGLRD
ncbi:MAG: 4-hydroxy-tetrahydrodipicolinate reductase [Verrucomicrobiota bacterium]